MVDYVLERMKDNWLIKKEKWLKRRKREKKIIGKFGETLKKKGQEGN